MYIYIYIYMGNVGSTAYEVCRARQMCRAACITLL